ncbi:hypothetical protein GDO81_009654 [Engystomops pustulosus]|uniref:Uncharacterized protein n=1 Tax=Engystomops pustulosus TaxID=76066 RepID=A0AAV7BTV2_ENGPU|nr:hypothetical protein GDO81_009654 [Engystomops pustulosus]
MGAFTPLDFQLQFLMSKLELEEQLFSMICSHLLLSNPDSERVIAPSLFVKGVLGVRVLSKITLYLRIEVESKHTWARHNLIP